MKLNLMYNIQKKMTELKFGMALGRDRFHDKMKSICNKNGEIKFNV